MASATLANEHTCTTGLASESVLASGSVPGGLTTHFTLANVVLAGGVAIL